MDNIKRRDLLVAASLIGVHQLLPRAALAEAAPKTAAATVVRPSIHEFRVGAVKVYAISDGYIDAPFGAFTGIPETETAARFRGRHAQKVDGARLGFTVWYIEDGSEKILIDSGAAGIVSPTSGRLPTALAALGVKVEKISTVAATHMHADHIGGLIAGNRAAFGKSNLLLPETDFKHFTDAGRANAAPPHLKGSFDISQKVAGLYPKAEKIAPKHRVSAHIEAIDLNGHTPGHLGYRIADGDMSLVIVGDLLFDPAVHPDRDDVGIAFEADPAAAKAMRAKAFPQFAEEGALLAATHMPFPGLGRIVKEGDRLRWLAADWDYLA